MCNRQMLLLCIWHFVPLHSPKVAQLCKRTSAFDLNAGRLEMTGWTGKILCHVGEFVRFFVATRWNALHLNDQQSWGKTPNTIGNQTTLVRRKIESKCSALQCHNLLWHLLNSNPWHVIPPCCLIFPQWLLEVQLNFCSLLQFASQCTVPFWPGESMTKGCFYQSNSGVWSRVLQIWLLWMHSFPWKSWLVRPLVSLILLFSFWQCLMSPLLQSMPTGWLLESPSIHSDIWNKKSTPSFCNQTVLGALALDATHHAPLEAILAWAGFDKRYFFTVESPNNKGRIKQRLP